VVAELPFEVPEPWQSTTLGAISLKIGSGATPAGGKAAYLPARERWALIRSQNVFDRHFDDEGLAFISDRQAEQLASVTVQSGDLLLNITGDGVTFGRACQVPIGILPCVVNQHVSIVRVNQEQADPGFVLSYLTHPSVKRYIESFNSGGSRRAVTKGHIESFRLGLPPLAEQSSIAAVLGALDAKIEVNRGMNRTLEALASAIFNSWFVDFDPVVAKSEGRTPFGMSAEMAELFPASFDGSQLGPIPTGWEFRPLREAVELGYGKSLPATSRRAGSVAVFGSDGQIGWHDWALVKGPGVVVGRKGSAGRVNWSQGDFFPIDTTFYVIRLPGGLPMAYLFRFLSKLDLEGVSGDSAVPGLNREVAYSLPILFPPTRLTAEFESAVNPINERVAINERESRTLAQLRDLLLPKLMSGEIRVGEAEKALAAV
jgi:type I restriction enzyme S subunit